MCACADDDESKNAEPKIADRNINLSLYVS